MSGGDLEAEAPVTKKDDIRVVCSAAMTREDWLSYRTYARSGTTRELPDNSPYQVFAMRGPHVVGYWKFNVVRYNGTRLHSRYTYVSARYRRRGLARRMWDCGLAFWRPDKMTSSVGSWAGWGFLKASIVRYRRRGVQFDVSVDRENYPDIYKAAFEDVMPLRKPRVRKTQPVAATLEAKPKTQH